VLCHSSAKRSDSADLRSGTGAGRRGAEDRPRARGFDRAQTSHYLFRLYGLVFYPVTSSVRGTSRFLTWREMYTIQGGASSLLMKNPRCGVGGDHHWRGPAHANRAPGRGGDPEQLISMGPARHFGQRATVSSSFARRSNWLAGSGDIRAWSRRGVVQPWVKRRAVGFSHTQAG